MQSNTEKCRVDAKRFLEGFFATHDVPHDFDGMEDMLCSFIEQMNPPVICKGFDISYDIKPGSIVFVPSKEKELADVLELVHRWQARDPAVVWPYVCERMNKVLAEYRGEPA